MKRWLYWLSVILFVIVSSTGISNVHAQVRPGHQDISSETSVTNDYHGGHASSSWEGSVEGMAFSEFNHHFAGLCDVVFGLAELGYALRYPVSLWTRFILPGALGVVGGFVLIWSDHDAWPIGSLGFVDTFFGQDWEIIEHKLYGVFAIAIAFFETLRRVGKVRHPAWAAPLIFLVLASALSLFVHSHGNHPAAAKIQFHHSLLGIVGVSAALSKGVASWLPRASPQMRQWWEVVWAASVILFGFLLLVYSE